MPGDYAGTGRAQLAVYRPTTGLFAVRGLGALPVVNLVVLEEEVRQIRDPRNRFRADVARLARVGYASRLLDAISEHARAADGARGAPL